MKRIFALTAVATLVLGSWAFARQNQLSEHPEAIKEIWANNPCSSSGGGSGGGQ